MIILNNRPTDDSGEASFVQQFVAPPSLLASQLIVPVSPFRWGTQIAAICWDEGLFLFIPAGMHQLAVGCSLYGVFKRNLLARQELTSQSAHTDGGTLR